MTDRIVLRRMVFQGRHGYTEEERAEPQPFEVDVELVLNLQPAGVEDDVDAVGRLRPGVRDRA